MNQKIRRGFLLTMFFVGITVTTGFGKRCVLKKAKLQSL